MKKKYIFFILATVFMALVAIIFFYPDDVEGNVLQQHDTMQGIANGQEGKAFTEATGETTRWTNSLFGGMPNFQIAPSYPANALLSWIGKVYTLGLPSPANLLFAMMAGFFIMCMCMRMRWHVSLFAAVAWGFSSYFIIIIGAGHIWKFVTLAYIPPTIGGLALLYRRKYLAGTALTALFGALQLQSNHPQMTYYFLFVVAALIIAWLAVSIRDKRLGSWANATGLALAAGLIAVGANSASLYNSYEYAKETVRGRATDLTVGKPASTGGMDRSAITAWSYGIDETFTLLIPNVKGGATIQPIAGENHLKSVAETSGALESGVSPEELQFVGQFPQYFGDQPMTNGPVYVGAFVLMLAILALFTVRTPMKWALFAVSILALLLSWGHNFDGFTNFFIDHFPGYNKFRAVSSILVVVEFTVPLLAALAIREMLERPEGYRRNPWLYYLVFGGGALVCLIGWMSPSVFGQPFSADELAQLQQAGAFTNPMYSGVINAIREGRLGLVSADCGRSLIFILLGTALVWAWFKGLMRKEWIFGCSLVVLTLIDMYPVDARYVNHDNFTAPVENEEAFNMTDADRLILQDTTNYRVLDVANMGGARSSYFHKTIGGYHAAKLTRYNDLLEQQIYKGNPGVLNMLNTRYILAGDSVQMNPDALGNAWIVEGITYADTPDAEMAALDTLDTRRYAVADKKFSNALGQASPKAAGDTIYETSYAPNRLTYKARSAKGGVAVFSEIYFPWGWDATVDGKPVEIGRANYTLRAIRLAPGTHDIEFRFDPKSLRVTNAIGIGSVIAIYALCLLAVVFWGVLIARRNKENSQQHKQK
ncbi:MAG: YfhO family protein [Muribaculaceae bacterium]|nr:YfhO family protein [Muribaculaceae bacterium]